MNGGIVMHSIIIVGIIGILLFGYSIYSLISGVISILYLGTYYSKFISGKSFYVMDYLLLIYTRQLIGTLLMVLYGIIGILCFIMPANIKRTKLLLLILLIEGGFLIFSSVILNVGNPYIGLIVIPFILLYQYTASFMSRLENRNINIGNLFFPFIKMLMNCKKWSENND